MSYVKIFCPKHPNSKKGFVMEHRLVLEKHLNRYLKKNEVVHHIDENKNNNKLNNLLLFPDNKSHMKFHTKIRQFGMTTSIIKMIENQKSYK